MPVSCAFSPALETLEKREVFARHVRGGRHAAPAGGLFAHAHENLFALFEKGSGLSERESPHVVRFHAHDVAGDELAQNAAPIFGRQVPSDSEGRKLVVTV